MNDDGTKPPTGRGMIIKTDQEKALDALHEVFASVQAAGVKLGIGVVLISVRPDTGAVHLESTMPPEVCVDVLRKAGKRIRKGRAGRIVRSNIIPFPTGGRKH